MQPNKEQVANLRKNPMVQHWIAEFQKGAWFPESYPECPYCGWPHNSHILCGMGATFGKLTIGRDTYSVDASNVEYFVKFRDQPMRGFHWRDDVFFERLPDGTVEVRWFTQYNNTPQPEIWRIAPAEWASIVCSVSALGETGERWNAAQDFHGRSTPTSAVNPPETKVRQP